MKPTTNPGKQNTTEVVGASQAAPAPEENEKKSVWRRFVAAVRYPVTTLDENYRSEDMSPSKKGLYEFAIKSLLFAEGVMKRAGPVALAVFAVSVPMLAVCGTLLTFSILPAAIMSGCPIAAAVTELVGMAGSVAIGSLALGGIAGVVTFAERTFRELKKTSHAFEDPNKPGSPEGHGGGGSNDTKNSKMASRNPENIERIDWSEPSSMDYAACLNPFIMLWAFSLFR